MSNDSLAPELDDLLDGDLDSLPDSNFDAWPAGTYHAGCTAQLKEVSGHPVCEFSFKMIEAKELANAEDSSPAVGAINSELCFLDNDGGKASLKKMLRPFAEVFGVGNIRELIDMIQDVEVLVHNKRRFDKKNDVWRFAVDAIAVA